MLGSMAEPSLLCVNCARAPPPHRCTWDRCTVCVARNLPSTYYCGEECMNAHWPKHKVWHKVQKERAKWRREGTLLEHDRSLAEAEARRAEATGSEYDKRFAAAVALNTEGDSHGAVKAWRKIIKQWPNAPDACHNLAIVLDRADRYVEAAQMFLNAMKLLEDGSKQWTQATASAFDVLKHPSCDEMPKPEWWNDEALKALSARVVALAPDSGDVCSMRAFVLSGDAVYKAPWKAGPRTAAEIKEAATWFRRGARFSCLPARKLRDEMTAIECDEVADPLLAQEEAEAAEALAVAEAKAKAALEAAEAKAKAAADELLAEEEKEKQQAASTKASKAKQGKGKKGKGRR